MEPVMMLTASAIAQLAFEEFIKSGASELAKKSLTGTADVAKRLREKIRARLSGTDQAKATFADVEQRGSQAALADVTRCLDLEMSADKVFAADIQQLAQQIVNIQAQGDTNRQFNNFGRDMYSIEQIHGNPKLGGG